MLLQMKLYLSLNIGVYPVTFSNGISAALKQTTGNEIAASVQKPFPEMILLFKHHPRFQG